MTYVYLVLLVMLVWTALARQNHNARWRYVAARERSKLRHNIRSAWRDAERQRYEKAMATAACDVEKLLVVKGGRLAREQTGYIHIEIPELMRWLAWENNGVQELMARAVSRLAVQKLGEVLA